MSQEDMLHLTLAVNRIADELKKLNQRLEKKDREEKATTE